METVSKRRPEFIEGGAGLRRFFKQAAPPSTGLRTSLRYDLGFASVYSGDVLSGVLSGVLSLSKGLSKGCSMGCPLNAYSADSTFEEWGTPTGGPWACQLLLRS
ncbi:MAG: hypothetical protein MAG451_00062 [Anaerolineales bacterium]|nr:hypothetical protein [Anaerolineales bacterium]